MSLRLLTVTVGTILVAVTTAGAQEAIGPVTPKPAGEIAALEKRLQALIKDDAAAKVWKGANAAKLQQFMEQVDGLTGDIHSLGIGPVTPKPPKPVNATPLPKPGPRPSQKSVQDSVNDLLEELQDAKKRNPQMTLPADDARELQHILDTLSKGELR